MANSPTMCQLFVGKALEKVRQEYPSVRFLHYMDDILIAAKTEQMVQEAYTKDRSDPIWIPERLVRRVQETPRRQDEVSDADDAPVHPIAGTE
ncbi:hypothetical protein STEG23_004554 [Scotinomys teguina]